MTTVSSGQTDYVSYGETESGTTVLSGGDLTVEFGGISVSSLLSGGGKESLSGTASGTVVAGGTLAISAGALASDTVVSAGSVWVHGSASGTVVSGGFDEVYSGGVDVDPTLYGGTLIISSGGEALGASVFYGATAYIEKGAIVKSSSDRLYAYGESIDIAGRGVVEGGAVLSGATVYGEAYSRLPAYLIVSSGGSLISSQILWGGSENLLPGAVASDTTILFLGSQTLSSGSIAFDTVDSGGYVSALPGATLVNLSVLGGFATIDSGATVKNLLVGQYATSGSDFPVGTATVAAGALVSGALEAGENAATLIVGGTSIDDQIGSIEEIAGTLGFQGGAENVLSGGIASHTVCEAGYLLVSSGGMSISAAIYNGFDESDIEIESGGIASDTSLIDGGVMIVFSGGVASNIGFTGSGDDLFVVSAAVIKGAISGFVARDTIDLGMLAYKSSAETLSYIPAAGGGSGTLTVSSGGSVVSLSFVGSYVTSDFVLSADSRGNGDTTLTTTVTSAAILQLHHLTAAIAGFSTAPAATPAQEPETGHHPLLAAPR